MMSMARETVSLWLLDVERNGGWCYMHIKDTYIISYWTDRRKLIELMYGKVVVLVPA